jgi:hypothetical protein
MKQIRLFLLLTTIIIATQSCNIVNPAEPVPTYVHIDSFSFQQTPNTGSTSHKITSVWVYFDNKTIGAFNLPCNIPIITSEPGLIMVRPGVTVDGVSDLQTPYFQYQNDTLTISPNPGKTINFYPKTHYNLDRLYGFINQDFESGNPFQKIGGDTNLIATADTQFIFEGNYAGLITLDTQKYSVNLFQTSFTVKGNPFIEIDYKNTAPFMIGLQTTNNSGQAIIQYIAGFNSKAFWNKAYISLVDFTNQYQNKEFRLVVYAYNASNNPTYVALDNIKISSVN